MIFFVKFCVVGFVIRFIGQMTLTDGVLAIGQIGIL